MQPPAAMPDPEPPAPVAVRAAVRAPALFAYGVGRPRLCSPAAARLPILPPLAVTAAPHLVFHLHSNGTLLNVNADAPKYNTLPQLPNRRKKDAPTQWLQFF